MIPRIRGVLPGLPAGRWIAGEFGAAVLDDPRATRTTLDEVTARHPLALHAASGHGLLLNTAALHALGVSDTAPDPPGGCFARMPDGRTRAYRP